MPLLEGRTCIHLWAMLFADDAALASHFKEGLQRLMDCFSLACSEFGLKISIKKTEVMCQDTSASPAITISGATLAVVDDFKYLGSVISSNMSLDAEISTHQQGSSCDVKTQYQGVDKQQPVTAHQALCLPGMHHKHSSIWQRNLDNIHPSRERTEHVP